ncbi:phosphoadenylyl-sulfate reductase [Oleiagrimonas soli]|uniref:Adenosine 5'-phosphosulfate reductase n=1 Tax=Oleiagrimonas soli TaxID=1543381 RepID=A0A099CXS4_9GAMM|nr:phosphoadenylyl-sulfate reductase [Oleiagrimonas soli]KGI78514.1 phosphoadenosine phosphosulfate reductase [Oleiagrimonas soli]MBB6184223.1 phosphoadenosine phosphosulfate reductase [Oleiagrimonas soli]
MELSEIELAVREAASTLDHIADNFAPAALVTAFGPESMVMIDLIAKHELGIQILSMDTGRLPEATHTLIQRVREVYGLPIRLLHPDPIELGEWVERNGNNAFRDSVDKRLGCCRVRKVQPLKQALAGKNAWVTGLRRKQAASRHDTQRKEWDADYGLHKFSPLYEWSDEQVWTYIRGHGVPYNELHDLGYPSIGCAPCTRAVKPGEDARAGRWWWEHETPKECGLHFNTTTGVLERA